MKTKSSWSSGLPNVWAGCWGLGGYILHKQHRMPNEKNFLKFQHNPKHSLLFLSLYQGASQILLHHTFWLQNNFGLYAFHFESLWWIERQPLKSSFISFILLNGIWVPWMRTASEVSSNAITTPVHQLSELRVLDCFCCDNKVLSLGVMRVIDPWSPLWWREIFSWRFNVSWRLASALRGYSEGWVLTWQTGQMWNTLGRLF